MPRKKNFDVDEALRKAGEVFWTHGYEASSMEMLLDAMGIQKGSFYDTYGSKRDAYKRALQQYIDERRAGFAALTAGLSPLEAIRAQLEAIASDCGSEDGHRGCMVANCALELAHEDLEFARIVQRDMGAYEDAFERRIREAQALGEVSRDVDPAPTAKALLALVLGARVYARAGAPGSTTRAVLDRALSLLR